MSRTPDALLAALEAVIDARVEAKLASLGIAAPEYRSSAPARDVSRRTHNRVCRSGAVAGAYRDGPDWVCSAAAWREARGQGPSRPSRPTLTVVQNNDAATLLERAGLRRTR